MPVKLRLQRHGKKGKPYYQIVAADSRSKRDGKYIEKVGNYNPNTNPATINLNFERALYWLENGAQPTDTCRAILSYKGVLLKNHLNKGVKKGALTQEQADAKFEKWLQEKEAAIQAKRESLAKKSKEERSAMLKQEKEIRAKREEELKAASAELAAEAEAAREAAAAEGTPEAQAEEAPAAEAATETPAEAKAEAPAEEAPAENNDAAEEKAAE